MDPTKPSAPFLREKWNNERAFRIGGTLARISLILCSVALVLNSLYAGWAEISADVALIVGCALSLYLTKRNSERRKFVWWPFYLGFLVATLPSTGLSGGIYSPWLGMYLAVLQILGAILQDRISPMKHLLLLLGVILGWTVYARFVPLDQATAYIQKFPPIFMAVAAGITLTGIAYFVKVLTGAERQLASELERQYQELFETRANLLREESANLAKSSFLANISHELRTPLGAVLGYANLLQEKNASPSERLLFAQIIERNGQQLARLVDDLLDLSKVEAGRIELEKIPVELSEILAEVLNLLNISARKKSISLHVTFSELVPESILTDPVRFKQILTNIIGNAVKFTDRGAVDVRVRYSDLLGIQISVKDTGRGIAYNELDKLFKPFSQADASMTRKYGGTGLGLNFSRELARLLGGDLQLTWSKPGEGSEFTIRIPVELPAGTKMTMRFQNPLRDQAAAPVPEFNFKGARILIVDDSPDNRDMIQRFLLPTQAWVDEAADGIECLEKIAAGRYDLVLMDIQMPRLDGLQATERLRLRGFQAPIVAITAHAMAEDREQCLKVGCTAHIAKPIQRLELLSAIGRHLTPAPDCHPV